MLCDSKMGFYQLSFNGKDCAYLYASSPRQTRSSADQMTKQQKDECFSLEG